VDLNGKGRFYYQWTWGFLKKMSQSLNLRGQEPQKILQTVIEQNTPAIMSYMSKNKWHVTKVLLRNIREKVVGLEIAPSNEHNPVNVSTGEKIGVSIKYGYGKLIFDTIIKGFELSKTPGSGGIIVVNVPESVQFVQRRNYFRVRVPQSMNVNISLWRTKHKNDDAASARQTVTGQLIDLSAGGLQAAFNTNDRNNLNEGQYVHLKFTPLSQEHPIEFNAQIRIARPTADGRHIAVGFQMVGLETTAKGRDALQKICSVVEYYYHVNQSSVKRFDNAAAVN
jgi:c-di-GMP-binding flagellar brake protein YcgR